MTASQPGAVSPVPGHLHTVTPRLVVADGAAAIAFYARALGAEELGDRFTGPDGELIHAEIRIGDSVVMITEDSVDGPVSSPGRLDGMVTCVMSTYWENVDAAWERAVSAGAEVIYPLEDQFYGERGGRLRDPFGQQWMMSQHIEDVPADEMARRAAAFFNDKGGKRPAHQQERRGVPPQARAVHRACPQGRARPAPPTGRTAASRGRSGSIRA
jgi:PhnB protein